MGKKTERLFQELQGDNKKRAEAAAVELRLLSPQHYPRLLALADHPRAAVRARLCSALGQLGGYDDSGPRLTRLGVPTLLRLLAHDPRARVRAAAAHALARGYHVLPGMLPALFAAAHDPSKHVRRGVCQALGGMCWDEGVTAPQCQQLHATFLENLSSPDPYLRNWTAFFIHCKTLNSPEIRAALWRLVDDPKDAVRAEACAALGLLGDRAIVPYLVRQFESGTVWSWNLDAAVQLADPAFLPALRRLRKGYRKTHWFAKAVTKAIQDLQSRVS